MISGVKGNKEGINDDSNNGRNKEDMEDVKI